MDNLRNGQGISSMHITAAVCNAALRAALADRGYTLTESGTTLRATKAGRTQVILPIYKFIVDPEEEIAVSATFAGVKTLLQTCGEATFSALLDTNDASLLANETSDGTDAVIYCLAYVLCLGGYHTVETTLVDLRAFFKSTDRHFMIDREAGLFRFIRAGHESGRTNGILFRSNLRHTAVQEKDLPTATTPSGEFAPSIKSTTAVCTGVLQASLWQHGYDVIQNGSFLEASNGKHRLAILTVSRCLSQKGSGLETTPVSASFGGICKMLSRYGVANPERVLLEGRIEDLDVIVGNADVPGELSIAFSVAVYDYSHIEVVLVPLKEILRQAAYGNVFAIGLKSRDFFMDFTKANSDNMRHVILQDRYIESEDRGN